jgi:hypothetical protein
MIGSGKKKKQRGRNAQFVAAPRPRATVNLSGPAINRHLYIDANNNRIEQYCPHVELTGESEFSLFRLLILTSIAAPPLFEKSQLQKCAEPNVDYARKMTADYREYLRKVANGEANPTGREMFDYLLIKDNINNYDFSTPPVQDPFHNVKNIKYPIIFKTLFHIPVEIIDSSKFLRTNFADSGIVVSPHIKTLIMNKITNSLNNTNCGCKQNWYMPPETACPECTFDNEKLIKATHCPTDPCALDQNAAPKSMDLLVPLAERAEDMQVTINRAIYDAVNQGAADPRLSVRPYYIALNLFNSSTKSASHTAAIIVYKRELYSIGFSNWADPDEGQRVTHFQSGLDAKITSPEDYSKNILYQIQDAVLNPDPRKSIPARIALQNYQIIDMGFVTEAMCNKINDYFTDIIQIKATPLFEYIDVTNQRTNQNQPCILKLMWEPELEALPSQRTYSRVNACYYNYAPVEVTGAVLGATAGTCVGGVCGLAGGPAGAVLGAKIGASVGAAVGAAVPATIVRKPGYLASTTQPPKTVDPTNRLKTVNCAGFVEDIFGINCSKKIGRTLGQASAPTNCWLRLNKKTIGDIIIAIKNDSVSAFETALKKRTMFGNPWSGGKTNKKHKQSKNRKTRKHFRKTNKTRKNKN